MTTVRDMFDIDLRPWLLDSKSDPVIFCVPASGLAALPACWLAGRLAGHADSGVVSA